MEVKGQLEPATYRPHVYIVGVNGDRATYQGRGGRPIQLSVPPALVFRNLLSGEGGQHGGLNSVDGLLTVVLLLREGLEGM